MSTVSELVQQLLVAIEETTIFTVPPHFERWEDGFRSLDTARRKFGEIKVHLEHAQGGRLLGWWAM